MAALRSSFRASVQSHFMSDVWLNLHATDSKTIASVLATSGQMWPASCLGDGHAFSSVLVSMASTAGLSTPSSAKYHEPAKRPPKMMGAMMSPLGSASVKPSERGSVLIMRRGRGRARGRRATRAEARPVSNDGRRRCSMTRSSGCA